MALYFMYYNFVRTHMSIKTTPAIAAEVEDRQWTLEDLVDLIEERTPKPGPRGPYKKRRS